VAPCVVCTWHVETTSAGFLVEPQNQGRWFVSGLASKPLGRFLACLASKPVATVSGGLASKPDAMDFSSLTSKLVAMVSPGFASKPVVGFLVEPQNQGGGLVQGFPIWALKPTTLIW
jgi:hypothetical protein